MVEIYCKTLSECPTKARDRGWLRYITRICQNVLPGQGIEGDGDLLTLSECPAKARDRGWRRFIARICHNVIPRQETEDDGDLVQESVKMSSQGKRQKLVEI